MYILIFSKKYFLSGGGIPPPHCFRFFLEVLHPSAWWYWGILTSVICQGFSWISLVTGAGGWWPLNLGDTYFYIFSFSVYALHNFCFLELRMIAAGKFASLPRNMQMNHEFSLASSMDLLSSKPSLAEHHSSTCQDVSIHGTLPRKRKGTIPARSCDVFSHVGTLHYSKGHRPQGPFIQDIIEEYPLQHWKNDSFYHRYV